MSTVLSTDLVLDLATIPAGRHLVSAHLRTDPRDPANTASTPAWRIKLRNGLAEVGDLIDNEGDRDTILAFRDFRTSFEERVSELVSSNPGRSLSVFASLDREYEKVVASQLPLRESVVRWESTPYVRPLWELADRGRAMAVVALDGDEVVTHLWADGRLEPLDEASRDLDGWRSDLPGGGGRGPRFRSHEQQMDARADEHGRRFLTDAGERVGAALEQHDLAGIVLIAAPGTAADFTEALPKKARDLVVTTLDAHLTGASSRELEERLDEVFTQAWHDRGVALLNDTLARRNAGGAGACGVGEVLDALTERRVEHLVATPDLVIDRGDVSSLAAEWLSHTSDDHLTERMLEQAAASGAEVSILPDHEALAEAGGVVATLRW